MKILKSLVLIPLVLIVLGMIGGAWYWYQYRPSEIRKQCAEEIENKPGEISLRHKELRDRYDAEFDRCLNKHGIK